MRLSACYQDSVWKRCWETWVARESSVYQSRYAKTLRVIGTGLLGLYQWMAGVWATSGIQHGLHVIGNVVRESRLSKCCRFHTRQVLLFGIGLYLPLDWFLRDVIQIGVVASLWDEAFFLVGCAAAVWAAGRREETAFGSHVTPLDIPILLFCGIGFLLMCVNAPVFGIAVDGYRATVQYMLWFFVVIRLIRNDTDALVLVAAVCATGLAMAFHGCWQYIVATPIPESWVSQTEAGVRTRAFSITGSPNILGSYLVLSAPIVASLSYVFHNMWKKVLAWGAVGIMCLCLLVTFSRGAWVGMCVAVIVFALVLDRRIFAPLFVAVPVAMFIPSIANRITYLFTDDFAVASAVGGRALRWEVGREMMQTNPWIGFGLGRFGGAVAMQNQILEETETFSYFYMDNYYLKIGAEMGYTGLIAFLVLIGALLWLGLRSTARAKRSQANCSPVVAGIFSGLCGVVVHCYFENIFEVPYMMGIFWSLAAVMLYFGYLRKRKT